MDNSNSEFNIERNNRSVKVGHKHREQYKTDETTEIDWRAGRCKLSET